MLCSWGRVQKQKRPKGAGIFLAGMSKCASDLCEVLARSGQGAQNCDQFCSANLPPMTLGLECFPLHNPQTEFIDGGHI